MPTVLLDTDVFSFLLKGDSRANSYAALIQGHRLALSFMTVAELFQWAAVRKWGARRLAQLEQTLTAYLIVPVDIEMCRIWGRVRAERQAVGRPLSPQDAWVAATALRHTIPLVTHNVGDYLGITTLDMRTVTQP
jgi:tRNA(fMet)-specific endonuclease VapC